MSAKVLITEEIIQDIADAIRQKLGVETQYKPSEMADAISAISGGGTLDTLTIVQNGTYTPGTGYDGFSEVTANVPNSYSASDEGKVVSNGALVAQTAMIPDITQNGTYDTTLNNEVTVNVSEGGLPSAYQRVLYIQGDGSGAYIDTGIVPDSNTTVYLQAIVNSSTNQFLFGSRVARNNQSFDILYQPTAGTSNLFRVDYGNMEPCIEQSSDMSYLNVVFGAEGFSVNERTPSSTPTGYTGNQLAMFLFAGNSSGTAGSFSVMKCFSFIVKSGTSIVMELVPCRRKSDDEPGFYDTVSKTFFANAGSGSFTVSWTAGGQQ